MSKQITDNSTKVKTNRACFEFDLDAINRDFRFLCLKRDQGNWFGSPTLDQTLQDYPAKAVLYGFGSMMFIMFDATQDIEKIKHQLQSHDKLANVTIKIIQAIEQPQTDYDSATRSGIFGKWLAQILINSLTAVRASDQQPISNLGGKFYWLVSSSKFKALALKVEINFQGVLTLEAKNFSVQSPGWVESAKPPKIPKPQYVLETGGSFKRVFANDIKTKKPTTYIAKEFRFQGQTTKASLPFLTINNLAGFNKSKLGVWQQLHQRIKKRLNNYVRLSFNELKVIDHQELDKATPLKKRAIILHCKNIVLVDEIHSTQSQVAIHEIQVYLSALPDLFITQAEQTQSNALNIRLVHAPEHYKELDIADPYKAANPKHAIQHLILQTWLDASNEKAREPILQVCLKEAQLKQELLQQQLVSFDWPTFCKRNQIHQSVTFLKLGNLSREEREKHRLEPEHISLKRMQIQPSGQIEQSIIEDEILGQTAEIRTHQAWLQLARKARTEQKQKDYWLGDIIGLMVIGKQLFGFYESAMQVMPNYTQIGQVLKQIEKPLPEHWQTPQDWLQQLDSFKQQAPGLVADAEQCLRLDKFTHLLNEHDGKEILNRKQINQLTSKGLGKTTQAYKSFDAFIKKHGILLRFSKSQANLATHTPGLVELNIYQQEGAFGYSVGIPRSALQQTFERGTPIRWIKSLTEQPIEAEQISALLADLLDVDFIQAKQSGTVWPFVFSLM
ncbi:MAG: hypothetical protein IBX55_10645 [Methyloprofundus sp.]|nr:hypothetical protein [Methyloprofundus sp.]